MYHIENFDVVQFVIYLAKSLKTKLHWTSILTFNPLTPTKTTFHVELCNPITR